MFAAVALFALQPWSPTSLLPPPRVSPPKGDIGLGDAVVVPSPRRSAAADARVVDVGRSTLVAEPVAVPERGSAPELGISRGHPVRRSGLASLPVRPSEPPPPPAPAAAPLEQAPEPAPPPAPAPNLIANFENGLEGWSTSIGDAVPRVVTGIVRDGEKASVIRLTGDQSSSQLILGGDGGGSGAGAVQIHEGDEYAFAFSFFIQTMVYGEPGTDNLVLRFKSDASDSLAFGLELWDPGDDLQGEGERGLWSSGEAVEGDRFLAPVPERTWHDAIVHFKASSQGAGFYAVYLDGELVDARDGVSTIVPGSSYTQIEVGLFRDGEHVQGTSEIRLDAAKLGDTLESVQP